MAFLGSPGIAQAQLAGWDRAGVLRWDERLAGNAGYPQGLFIPLGAIFVKSKSSASKGCGWKFGERQCRAAATLENGGPALVTSDGLSISLRINLAL